MLMGPTGREIERISQKEAQWYFNAENSMIIPERSFPYYCCPLKVKSAIIAFRNAFKQALRFKRQDSLTDVGQHTLIPWTQYVTPPHDE